jgi:hypothetical protein
LIKHWYVILRIAGTNSGILESAANIWMNKERRQRNDYTKKIILWPGNDPLE